MNRPLWFLIFLLSPLVLTIAEGKAEEKRDGGLQREKQVKQNELNLEVPWFSQIKDWGEDYLGDSSSITLKTHGCALCCTAMVFRSYDINTNPRKLNKTLLKNNAFEKGWDDDSGEYLGRVRLIWEKAASSYDEVSSFIRYDFSNAPADLNLIHSYLDKEIPVIAEVLRPHGIPHFVVIQGYEGDDFLIRDPLDENTRFLSYGYNISDEYGSGAGRNIFGIRVFLPSANEMKELH